MEHREIKFRCFYEGKFVYFVIGQSMTDFQRTIYDQCCLMGLNFDQYTGLNDKNGKEIYEGDIVKCHDHPTEVDSATGEVYFSQGSWRVKDTICLLGDFGTAWTEVIGNIYENPDLLTPKEHNHG